MEQPAVGGVADAFLAGIPEETQKIKHNLNNNAIYNAHGHHSYAELCRLPQERQILSDLF